MDVSDVSNGLSSAHITVSIIAAVDDTDADCSDDNPQTDFEILAGNAGVGLVNVLDVAGLVVNTGITSQSNIAAGFDACVYYGEVTLAELTALDAAITTFNDVIVQTPADCDPTGAGSACLDGIIVTVTGVLAAP